MGQAVGKESRRASHGYHLVKKLRIMPQHNAPVQNSVGSPPRSVPAETAATALVSADEQQLVELKQWFTTNKFSPTVLERLIVDPGVTDVLDLAVLCDEELQRAGLSPIQLKRFAVLQHKMNEPNPAPSIPHLSKTRDDIRRQFIAGTLTREEAECMGRAVNNELAAALGPQINAAELFGIFVKTLDPKPDPLPSPTVQPIPEVPQVVSFIPPGLFTIKVSRPGDSDRFLPTDSNGKIEVKDLPSGCSLQPMTRTDPPIPIGNVVQLDLPLIAEKTVDVPSANAVRPIFQDNDKLLSNCLTTGNFVSAGDKTTVKISATTDERGSLNMVLPEGKISNLSAQSGDGKVTVAAKMDLTVPKRDPGTPPQQVQRIFSQLSSRIAFLNHCQGNHVAFLGDVSGSMGSGNKLDVLKRTLSSAVDEVLAPNSTQTVSLCAWDDSIEWFQGKRWLSAQDKTAAKSWIQGLCSRGGTDMRPAINDATSLKDVTDVVTLCDGEFGAFDFASIVRSHPEVKFHFVAIGPDAATGKMEEMARQGKGFFQHEK